MKELGKFNRFEVIDWHSGEGRILTKWLKSDFEVLIDEQDDGRTLKIFINKAKSKWSEE